MNDDLSAAAYSRWLATGDLPKLLDLVRPHYVVAVVDEYRRRWWGGRAYVRTRFDCVCGESIVAPQRVAVTVSAAVAHIAHSETGGSSLALCRSLV